MRRSAVWFLALLLTIGVAAGCNKARSDQDIATDIKAKLYSDPQLKGSGVDVAAKSGEVTLSGEVPSDTARYAAYKLATETPGVAKVNDRMTVKLAGAPPPAPEPEAAPVPAPVKKTPKRTATGRTHVVTSPAPPADAASTAVTTAAPAPVTPPTPQPRIVEIPAGTSIRISMIDSIDSAVNHSGEVFRAALDAPIVVDNEIVVPAGTDVYVKLAQARSAGHISGRSELGLELVRMQFQGKSYSLVSNEYRQAGSSRGKRTAATVGGGAALGALIGAVAGGGKGAAIGAGVGAAAGTGVQVATKGQQVRIPSETRLDFRLEQPVEVSYFPERNQTHPRH